MIQFISYANTIICLFFVNREKHRKHIGLRLKCQLIRKIQI